MVVNKVMLEESNNPQNLKTYSIIKINSMSTPSSTAPKNDQTTDAFIYLD